MANRIESYLDLVNALTEGLRGEERLSEVMRTLGMRMRGQDPMDWRISHTAPSNLDDVGASIDRLDATYPADVYTNPRMYGYDEEDLSAVPVIMAARGNPDMPIRIYRAVPSYASDIYTGDWVTPSLPYALGHARHVMEGRLPWQVISGTAPARTLLSEGNSLAEYGYIGEPILDAVRIQAQRGLGRKPSAALVARAKAGDEQAIRAILRNFGLSQMLER